MPIHRFGTLYQRLRARWSALSMRKVSDRSQIFPVFTTSFGAVASRRKPRHDRDSRIPVARSRRTCVMPTTSAAPHAAQQPPETARLFGLSMWQS